MIHEWLELIIPSIQLFLRFLLGLDYHHKNFRGESTLWVSRWNRGTIDSLDICGVGATPDTIEEPCGSITKSSIGIPVRISDVYRVVWYCGPNDSGLWTLNSNLVSAKIFSLSFLLVTYTSLSSPLMISIFTSLHNSIITYGKGNALEVL